MSKFWSKVVHGLTPYIPGEQPKLNNLIKLNTNENPYGPSPKVIAAIKEFTNDTLRLYPDPNSEALKKSIADYFNIKTNHVFVGNGSDEVLAIAFQALLKHNLPILFPDITYSFYPVYCKLYEIDFKTIPLNDSFEIALNEMKNGNANLLINYIIDGGEGINKPNFQKIIDFTRGNGIPDEKVYFIFQDFKLKDNFERSWNSLYVEAVK